MLRITPFYARRPGYMCRERRRRLNQQCVGGVALQWMESGTAGEPCRVGSALGGPAATSALDGASPELPPAGWWGGDRVSIPPSRLPWPHTRCPLVVSVEVRFRGVRAEEGRVPSAWWGACTAKTHRGPRP